MRYVMLAAALLLAGCAKSDADWMVAIGTVRIDPHPAEGAIRVSVVTVPDAPISLSSVDPNRDEGRAMLLATLFPEPCAAREEARIPTASMALGFRREQVVYRVTCPR
jgi:hypothetical protein